MNFWSQRVSWPSCSMSNLKKLKGLKKWLKSWLSKNSAKVDPLGYYVKRCSIISSPIKISIESNMTHLSRRELINSIRYDPLVSIFLGMVEGGSCGERAWVQVIIKFTFQCWWREYWCVYCIFNNVLSTWSFSGLILHFQILLHSTFSAELQFNCRFLQSTLTFGLRWEPSALRKRFYSISTFLYVVHLIKVHTDAFSPDS